MNSHPSSLVSTAVKTSDQKHLHLDGHTSGQAAPAYEDSGHVPQANSLNQFQHETLDRELGHVYWYDDGGQPPSLSDMRPVLVSLPSGGGNPMSTGCQPPSLNDVDRRASSQTGASLTGNRLMVDELELAGISLVGNKFRDMYPMAYRKKNDEKNE